MNRKLNPNADSFFPRNHKLINQVFPMNSYPSPSYIQGFQVLPPHPPSDPVAAVDHDHQAIQTVTTPTAAYDHDDQKSIAKIL